MGFGEWLTSQCQGSCAQGRGRNRLGSTEVPQGHGDLSGAAERWS